MIDLYGDRRVPSFIANQRDNWSNRLFRELSNETQARLLDFKLTICVMLNSQADEDRDVFIRLQSGSPLTGQEKRDALPSQVNELVMSICGRINQIQTIIPQRNVLNRRYQIHDIFSEYAKMPSRDRGRIRQLSASLLMLYIELMKNNRICDIGASALDDFYFECFSLDLNSIEVKNFLTLLDDIYLNIDQFFGSDNDFVFENHDLIHLILFIGKLQIYFNIDWQNVVLPAYNEFHNNLRQARNMRTGEYWSNYGTYIGVSANSKVTIYKRHIFFVSEMNRLTESRIISSSKNIEVFPYNEQQYLRSYRVLLDENMPIPIEIISPLLCGIDYLGNITHNIRTHRATGLIAVLRDGSVLNADSPDQLYRALIPNINGAINAAMLIFGKIDRYGVVTQPNNAFWNEVVQLSFKMNNRDVTLERSDFGDYYEERFV